MIPARPSLFYPACALLMASAFILRWVGLPFQTEDMRLFLLPWFDYIVNHGRFAALSDNFYNYTPPYIYLLTLASYFDGWVARPVLIKAVSILFDFSAAFLVFKIVRTVSHNKRRALLMALLFLNLPTVVLNGAVWGQCDIIWTNFILAFAYFLLRKMPFYAMLMYGIALSLKVQAIFLAPFVLYLFLTGIVPWLYAMLPPLIYGLLCLPAALAGRSWDSLLAIYAEQAGMAYRLSLRAPNIYVIIQHFLPPALYPAATFAGIAVTALVSGILVVTHLRQKPPLPSLFVIVALALWFAVVPMLLPRMHERYFFIADIFTFLLAVTLPRTAWIAVLFQIGSVLAYSYFMSLDYNFAIDFHPAAMIGALAIIPATVGIGYYYRQIIGGPRSSALNSRGGSEAV